MPAVKTFDRWYDTIEVRIAGSSLSESLPLLVGAARRDALLAYAEASTRVAEVGVPPGRYGEVVAHLRGHHGLYDEDLQLYGLFYAFRFLDTKREDLFRWCTRTIQAAC